MTDIENLILELSRHPPFDVMAPADLVFLAERVSLRNWPTGQVILDASRGAPDGFYIIRSGGVLVERALGSERKDATQWQLGPGECFPFAALLSKSPVASTYRAGADTDCWVLPADSFLQLKDRSAPFCEFCTRRLASLVERSKQILQQSSARNSQDLPSMDRLLSTVVRREPVSCRPEDPIEDVLKIMHQLTIGSMVITDAAGAPLGIFTLHDVLNRVALPRRDLSEPISTVMSTGLVALPPHATAYEAALAMVRRGIRHVLVVDGGKLAGIVSEKDLFSLQRISMRQLSSDIKSASDAANLPELAAEVRQLARNMLSQGVSAEQLTHFIASLNDLITQRAVDLEYSGSQTEGTSFCWLALGSEGRFEQTLSTDQDNGIVFSVPAGSSADQVRARLLPAASRVNKVLDACGFPLCKGNIMAGNPKWCLSLDEWQARFAGWIDSGDPEALLHGAIFFDFRPLHGETGLGDKLREWLSRHAKANPRFLHQMAANALQNRPPLGMLRDFVVESSGEHRDTIDLKLNGAMPFVDAARIYSLATGVAATNTAQRLRKVAPDLRIPREEIEAWIEAFYFIQAMRLKNQHLDESEGRASGNRINPYALNELDKRILKEAFRQARKLQSRLALDYRV